MKNTELLNDLVKDFKRLKDENQATSDNGETVVTQALYAGAANAYSHAAERVEILIEHITTLDKIEVDSMLTDIFTKKYDK